MSKVVRLRWSGSIGGDGLSRRDREGCDYEAYVPDLLTGRELRLDADVAADVADAEAAIARLNIDGTSLADTEALARLLLRSESVASSHIEGLHIGGCRLLRAEAARGMGVPADDVTAEEVLGNIEAMAWAVESLSTAAEVTLDGVLEVHRRLLARTPLAASFAGRVRERQNWIGGSAFTPCRASFVPPPPHHLPELLDDVLASCNRDVLPPVAQAAVVHAQFETIHPFSDGNGRVGRALVHVVLRRRGLAPRVLPPVSMALARSSGEYIDGLTATRYRGRADSRAAHDGINRWIAMFAVACRQAVDDALAFEERIADIQRQWRSALGQVRAGSSVDLLVRRLPGAPIVTAAGAAELVGRSFQAANEAVDRLVDSGVLRQVTVGKRNRAFEAKAVIDVFADFERRLSSP